MCTRFFPPVQTIPRAQPSFLHIGYQVSFPVVARNQLGLLSQGPEGQTGEVPGSEYERRDRLWLVILSVQQTLIADCEDNCPLKLAKTGRHFLKRTSELMSLRK
jgi:hypothetical protein